MLRCLLAVPLALAALPATAGIDLEGTWYVLVHYRDAMTANPDADRWLDKVWTIEKKGSRLEWTEYPIVVFQDGSGRFGRVGGNPRARLLHRFAPNEAQMAEIREGPRVNRRGSKTKALRASGAGGFRSSSAQRTASALTVGYQETWSIDDPAGLPVFTRDDALGVESALATGDGSVVSGRTRYTTREIAEDGDLLIGSYARDEYERGSFRLIRAGAVRGLESDGRTPNEKAEARAWDAYRENVREAAYAGFLRSVGTEGIRELRAVLGEDVLHAIWMRHEQPIVAGDTAARDALARDLREAYGAAVREQVGELLAASGDALLQPAPEGLDPDAMVRLRRVRGVLGEDRLASLRARYGDGLRRGDARAAAEFRQAVVRAYAESVEAVFDRGLEEAPVPQAGR